MRSGQRKRFQRPADRCDARTRCDQCIACFQIDHARRRSPTSTEIAFENGNRATLVVADDDSDPTRLVDELGLTALRGRPVIAVFGGVNSLGDDAERQEIAVIGPGIASAAHHRATDRRRQYRSGRDGVRG